MRAYFCSTKLPLRSEHRSLSLSLSLSLPRSINKARGAPQLTRAAKKPMILLEEIAQALKHGGWNRINNFPAANEASSASKQTSKRDAPFEIRLPKSNASDINSREAAQISSEDREHENRAVKNPGRAALPLVSVFHPRTCEIEHPGIVIYLRALARAIGIGLVVFSFDKDDDDVEKWRKDGTRARYIRQTALWKSPRSLSIFRFALLRPFLISRFCSLPSSLTKHAAMSRDREKNWFASWLNYRFVIHSEINGAKYMYAKFAGMTAHFLFSSARRNVGMSDTALGSPSFIRKNRRNARKRRRRF